MPRAPARGYLLSVAIFCTLAESVFASEKFSIPEKSIQKHFADHPGAFVMMNCKTHEISRFNESGCKEKLPPCSTFKIWNTLIGIETREIQSEDELFYKWDGVQRSIPDWNKDLTLSEAFKVSCVPAFQALARKIGADRMKQWIQKIHYGDENVSAGIDTFWLPAVGRKNLLISPNQQANMICQLANGFLPFSEKSRSIVKEIIRVKRTEKGILYGKTGTGTSAEGKYNMGWFVGYVESKQQVYAFACVIKGINVMGKNARSIVENLLSEQNLL